MTRLRKWFNEQTDDMLYEIFSEAVFETELTNKMCNTCPCKEECKKEFVTEIADCQSILYKYGLQEIEEPIKDNCDKFIENNVSEKEKAEIKVYLKNGCNPKEMVNNPIHYGGKDNPYECIKVLKSWLSLDEYKGFLKGNALKYLCRQGKKDDSLQEVKKAKWYIEKLIEELEIKE